MNLDQIHVLQTIVETGSFRAASEKLHRAQSAVSYAIKNLEEEFRINLFNREGYRAVLTMEGQAFLNRAQALLAQAKELESFGLQLGRGEESLLRIGLTAVAPLAPICDKMKCLRNTFPNTEIELMFETLSGEELVKTNQVDVALVEELYDHDEFEYKQCGEIGFVPVVSHDHPLASIKGIIERSSLMKHPQVIVRSTLQSKGRSAGVLKGSPPWYVTDFSSKKEFILNGLGWGRLPHHMVETELKYKKLRELYLGEHEQTKVRLFLIRRRNEYQGPVADYVWNELF